MSMIGREHNVHPTAECSREQRDLRVERAYRTDNAHMRRAMVVRHVVDTRRVEHGTGRQLDPDAPGLAQAIELHMAVAREIWNTPQAS